MQWLLAYFVAPTATTSLMRMFVCEEFDDGTAYLKADYALFPFFRPPPLCLELGIM